MIYYVENYNITILGEYFDSQNNLFHGVKIEEFDDKDVPTGLSRVYYIRTDSISELINFIRHKENALNLLSYKDKSKLQLRRGFSVVKLTD